MISFGFPVTGFDLWGSVFATGFVCTFYCTLVCTCHADNANKNVLSQKCLKEKVPTTINFYSSEHKGFRVPWESHGLLCAVRQNFIFTCHNLFQRIPEKVEGQGQGSSDKEAITAIHLQVSEEEITGCLK